MCKEKSVVFNREESTMKCLSIVKRLAVAVVAAAALTGPVTAAQALQFNVGDAVLVLYGNNTEYVQNLGSFSTLASTGIDLDLSSIMSSVGGANTIKYTLIGDTASTIFFGNSVPVGSWTAQNKNQIVPGTYTTALTNWAGQLFANSDARSLIPKADGLSFSNFLNPAGTDTLGGSIPGARRGSADIDSILYLLERQNPGAATSLAQVGTAFLNSANGHFAVSAVPVPAAVVLFATGVIGLVGIARRRIFGSSKFGVNSVAGSSAS